jgi:hypothetical protein
MLDRCGRWLIVSEKQKAWWEDEMDETDNIKGFHSIIVCDFECRIPYIHSFDWDAEFLPAKNRPTTNAHLLQCRRIFDPLTR